MIIPGLGSGSPEMTYALGHVRMNVPRPRFARPPSYHKRSRYTLLESPCEVMCACDTVPLLLVGMKSAATLGTTA
eukprot:3762699-Pyramimonas_sp.AAC.1